MSAAPIWLITGARQAGKTSFCRALAETARQAGWDAAGLLSPARFDQGVKTGILAEDLRTGEARLLASSVWEIESDLVLGDWRFDRQTLAWGSAVLAQSLPCGLLIVDELGPLELNLQAGWQTALEILARGAGYRQALVVVRPELQAEARRRFDITGILEIDPTRSTDEWVNPFWQTMMELKTNL